MAKKQNRVNYRNMTTAEILRNMSDTELDRNVRKGGKDAIREQAFRHHLQGRSMIHEPIRSVPELDEFKAAIMGEAESEMDTIRSKSGEVLYRRKLIRDGWDEWHYAWMTDERDLERDRRLDRLVAEIKTPEIDIGV